MRRNLHSDLHVAAENKRTLAPYESVSRLVLDHAIAAIETSR